MITTPVKGMRVIHEEPRESESDTTPPPHRTRGTVPPRATDATYEALRQRRALTEAQSRIASMEARLDAMKTAVTNAQRNVGALRSRLDLHEVRLGEIEEDAPSGESTESGQVHARLVSLEALAARVRAGDSALRKLLDEQQRERQSSATLLSEIDHRLSAMESDLVKLKSREATARDRLMALETRLTGSTSDWQIKLDRLITEVLARLDSHEQTLAALIEEREGDRDRGQARDGDRDRNEPRDEPRDSGIDEPPAWAAALVERVAHLESTQVGPTQVGPTQAGPTQAGPTEAAGSPRIGAGGTPHEDDLRRIRGIGPKFARALRALGVSGFADIAAWTDADVERIADALGTSPARIRRDGWVENARRLVDAP